MDNSIIENILNKNCTPSYIFDIAKLKERIKYLRKSLPERVHLCYAIKANTFIVKDIENEVDRLEVCSPGEYYICREQGVNSNKILISGVYKTPEVIKEMTDTDENINCYSIESMEQFKLLKSLNKNINVLIRITSGNQFGINDYEAEKIIKNRADYPNLNIKGLQYFSGTQKKSIKNLTREIEYMQNLIYDLKEKYGFVTEEFEYGPGFPVVYFQNEEFDEKIFLEEFSNIINSMSYDGKIILELGRSIAACSGNYITKVVDKKINKDQKYAILDGGIHHLVYYGQSMAMKLPYCSIYPKKDNYDEKWNLYGSLCTINDVLVKQFPAGNLEIGDILIFENTGAYCMTEGISLFLSRRLPSVFKIQEHGELIQLRDNIPTYKMNY